MSQSRSEIKALLARHGIRPRRHLGQHFLADQNLVAKIVRAADLRPGDAIVEVGAGTGTLTAALARTGHEVRAYEVDLALRPALAETLAGSAVDLRFEDVTKIDLGEALGDGSWVLVANLPYHVGTPLLLELLRHVPAIRRFVAMLQREVVDRLVARPGDAAYGLPSVVTALHTRVVDRFSVPPQVFLPPPPVQSAVVVLDRIAADPRAEIAVELAAAGFGHRRKMLRSALREVVVDPEAMLGRAGIDPTARAEELTVDDLLTLAGVYADLRP